VHSDFNCLSVLEYAVHVLQVEHVIVCGHYGCGGVQAAMEDHKLGLIDNWLRHIRDVRQKHRVVLEAIEKDEDRLEKLCELNVIEQVLNVCHTTIVQDAWDEQRDLTVHGWIYSLQNGLLKDVNTCISGREDLSSVYRMAAGGP
jgi:carbonic anhydrase